MMIKKIYRHNKELSLLKIEEVLSHEYKFKKRTLDELTFVRLMSSDPSSDFLQGSIYMSAFSPLYTFYIKLMNANEVEIKIEMTAYLWLCIVICSIFLFVLPSLMFGHAIIFMGITAIAVSISFLSIKASGLKITDKISKKINHVK